MATVGFTSDLQITRQPQLPPPERFPSANRIDAYVRVHGFIEEENLDRDDTPELKFHKADLSSVFRVFCWDAQDWWRSSLPRQCLMTTFN